MATDGLARALGATLRGGGGGSSQTPMIVNFTYDTPTSGHADVTIKEIYDAYMSGKDVICAINQGSGITAYIKNITVSYDTADDTYALSGDGIVTLTDYTSIVSATMVVFMLPWSNADATGTYYLGQATLI